MSVYELLLSSSPHSTRKPLTGFLDGLRKKGFLENEGCALRHLHLIPRHVLINVVSEEEVEVTGLLGWEHASSHLFGWAAHRFLGFGISLLILHLLLLRKIP
jgi:hypothetical protein